MSVAISSLRRSFYLNGSRIADPNPTFSIDQVQTFYTGTYPELNNASYTESLTDTEHKITFTTSVGHKG